MRRGDGNRGGAFAPHGTPPTTMKRTGANQGVRRTSRAPHAVVRKTRVEQMGCTTSPLTNTILCTICDCAHAAHGACCPKRAATAVVMRAARATHTSLHRCVAIVAFVPSSVSPCAAFCSLCVCTCRANTVPVQMGTLAMQPVQHVPPAPCVIVAFFACSWGTVWASDGDIVPARVRACSARMVPPQMRECESVTGRNCSFAGT